jgi:hypothetical protein
MNIVYHTAQNTTKFYGRYNYLMWRYDYLYVCNFPDFAKSWDIPPTGKKIYYKGKLLEYGRTGFELHGTLTLTHLKDTIW